MPYITTLQLTDRVGEGTLIDLTDRDTPATGAVVEAVITRAVADAEAVIDGYLKKRYALPITEVPNLITDLAGAITIWKLHVHEPGGKVETDYKDAMRQLRDIADGKISLPLPDGSEATETGNTGARMADRERPFTETTMKGLI